ncbi:hypothetical protein N7528_002996 [Penicillium herquei]|nr:hypothetical protein N7528_002996 [Penicillium herquei]
MVAIKKIFQQERNVRPSTSPGFAPDDSYLSSVESPTRTNLDPGILYPSPPSPALPSPFLKTGRSLDVSHHFEQIEKQFEDLHQHLGDRPFSSQSSLAPNVPGRFPIPKPLAPNARHIDLMDALASDPYYQEATPISPPTSPYNEDVAERNMTRFLRIQYRNGYASSRILSALYQEDVADRNIAKYSGPARSLSALSSRSSPPAPGRVRNLSRNTQRRNQKKPNWTSDGDLRNRSSPDESTDGKASGSNGEVRARRSAPSLYADEDLEDDDDEAAPPVIQRLGVPPAHKQGKRWSNTPLPDSPTLPPPMGDGDADDEKTSNSGTPPILQQPPSPTVRSSSLTKRSLSPPPGTSSRKNVRDLSINTQLAAKGRSKIAHRAIQPPTPSASNMKRAPSIAEVMNSPIAVSTPTPPPPPSPRFKVSEMMELFTKAYKSSSLSAHPTYESLQDAIVREINSHDAFKRVPVPTAAGPLFTPADQDSFDKSNRPELSRSASAGQFSKIMTKSSKKHKRNTESSRSISTSIPSKGPEWLFRKASSSPARRRHTDAPAPSPGLLAEVQGANEKKVPQTSSGEQITYMDMLMRASQDKGPTSHPAVSAVHTSASAPNTPGNVYCMQAHSSSSRDSRSSFSAEDSDDDIIHLPSVTAPPPRVQIEGVDDNNVRYVIDSSSATDAQKLMSWPQRLRRAHSPQPFCENSLSPLSRARMQLRGTRSVETY